jgi:hypothetical protein
MLVFGHDPTDALAYAQLLAAEPEVARWARDCAWVPGTGHCGNRHCSEACAFRPQREAEIAGVLRRRRIRRIFSRR